MSMIELRRGTPSHLRSIHPEPTSREPQTQHNFRTWCTGWRFTTWRAFHNHFGYRWLDRPEVAGNTTELENLMAVVNAGMDRQR